jgi:hypothetical protein
MYCLLWSERGMFKIREKWMESHSPWFSQTGLSGNECLDILTGEPQGMFSLRLLRLLDLLSRQITFAPDFASNDSFASSSYICIVILYLTPVFCCCHSRRGSSWKKQEAFI